MRTILLLLLFAVGCGDVRSSIDIDAAVIPPDADAAVDPPPPRRPRAIALTSGGGVATSSGHRLRVRIGGAQPAGRATSRNHNLMTGPGALP